MGREFRLGRRGGVVPARLILGAAGLLGVGFAVVLLLALAGGDGGSDSTAASDDAGVVLTPEAAEGLTADLTSGVPARVAGALVVPPGVRIDRDAAEKLGSLRSVEIDPDTFTASGAGAGTAEASVITADGEQRSWELLLQSTGDGWKIVQSTTDESK